MGPIQTPYPVFLRLDQKRCLVVGGGKVGERKLEGLVACGARVKIVSPVATDGIRAMVGDRVEWVARPFEARDLDGIDLAVAAADLDAVNEEVSTEARKRGIWVNDATSRERSDYIVPATVRRGQLDIAISTGGGSPAYAKLIREKLESEFGDEHGEMVALLEELRPKVKRAFSSPAKRRAFWDRLVTHETLDLIKSGQSNIVKERVAQWLSS
jgi:precorrin-2 dehydrogenase/sirohydrochlorin ferrochelatase